MAFLGTWSASAQTTQTPKWEVEFHGAWLFSTNPTGGAISLPVADQPLMTVTLTPTTSPLPSRDEPSWYFGDGTLLFNQATTTLGQVPDQIVPLDPGLTGPALPPAPSDLTWTGLDWTGLRRSAGTWR
jgi:hypothetical protein